MTIQPNSKYSLKNGKEAFTKDSIAVLYTINSDNEEVAFDVNENGIPIYKTMENLGYSVSEEVSEFSVVITGFSSKAEAEAFVEWYDGSGEQNSFIWFEARKFEGKIKHSIMNVSSKIFPLKWNNNSIEMKLELFE